jgi:hypothetical protein
MVATTYSRLFNYRIGIHLLQVEQTNEVDTIAIHCTLHQVIPKLGAKGQPQIILGIKKSINSYLSSTYLSNEFPRKN